MKVIPETCHAHLIQYLHLYWCEVTDEGYFRNVSCTLNSISTFVLVWGTWWKLFQKRVMHTYVNIYICIGVRYLMKFNSERYHAHLIQYVHLYWCEVYDESYSRNLSCILIQYLHLYWCEVPVEGYFRNVSCTLNSISTFVFVWVIWWKLFQKRVMHT